MRSQLKLFIRLLPLLLKLPFLLLVFVNQAKQMESVLNLAASDLVIPLCEQPCGMSINGRFPHKRRLLLLHF